MKEPTMTTTGPYDDMGRAVDDAGEEWAGITAESGALAHTTVYAGAVLSVHDPKHNTTSVIRLSAADAATLAEDLAAAADDPSVSEDTETDGGWRP